MARRPAARPRLTQRAASPVAVYAYGHGAACHRPTSSTRSRRRRSRTRGGARASCLHRRFPEGKGDVSSVVKMHMKRKGKLGSTHQFCVLHVLVDVIRERGSARAQLLRFLAQQC